MNTKNPIRIGFNHKFSSALEKVDFIHMIPLNKDLNNWENVLTSLNNEEIDACVVELINIPFDDKNNVKIAALFHKDQNQYQLVITKGKVALGRDMRLADGATVGVMTHYVKSQVRYLNEKLDCTVINNSDFLRPEFINSYDAFVVESADLHFFSMDNFEAFPIHLTEIWPKVGKGIWALVTLQEKIEFFKELRHFHNFDISDITQPARQLKKWTQEKGIDMVEAYCSKDIQGNYHFHATRFDDNFIRHRISESTNALLAEKMMNALNF